MKKSTIKFLSIFLAISVLICTFNVSVFASDDVEDSIEKVYCEATIEDDFTDNEILIVVTPENNFIEYTINDFSAIGCVEIEDLTIEPKENELCRIFHLTLSVHSKQNVLDSIKVLEEREDIYCAEPNYKALLTSIPDDPYYNDNEQWALNKIQLPAAWNIETGSDSVKVGVIDTGIDASHPDLINRVNVALSKSFVDHYPSATSGIVSDHGTYVAGIIGAEANNDFGITGVCQDVELVALRVDLPPNSNGEVKVDMSAVVSAVNYADETGIKILNFSGVIFGNIIEKLVIQTLLVQILNFDGLFVCAAGNTDYNNDIKDSNDATYYPSSFISDNLISVGASTQNDSKWIDSNYGKSTVDIFAPGENIYSTVKNGGIGKANGTSSASPIVAGVAALLLSAHPELTAAEIKTAIMSSVDIVYSLNGSSVFGELCVSGGRINARKALENDFIHNYSCVNTGNHTTHTCVCLDCGYTKTENHPMLINAIDSNMHRCSCSECGYETQQSHTMTYAYVDSGTHYYKCTICAYKVQQNHTWTYTSINSREHKVECRYQECGFDYTENHVMNLLTGKCRICGYDSNGMGTLNRLLGLL